jgi:hypothetical protein
MHTHVLTRSYKPIVISLTTVVLFIAVFYVFALAMDATRNVNRSNPVSAAAAVKIEQQASTTPQPPLFYSLLHLKLKECLSVEFNHTSYSGPSDRNVDCIQRIVTDRIATNKFFVEIGWNIPHCNPQEPQNTQGLRYIQGWKGLAFDIDNENVTCNVVKARVSTENIVSLLVKHQVPMDVDYISIDIDSFDIWLFEAIITSSSPSKFRPRFVSVEHNMMFGDVPWAMPDPSWEVKYNLTRLSTLLFTWGATCVQGCGARSLYDMALRNGYAMIAVTLQDSFFIRIDLLEGETVPSYGFIRTHFINTIRIPKYVAEVNWVLPSSQEPIYQWMSLVDTDVWYETKNYTLATEAVQRAYTRPLCVIHPNTSKEFYTKPEDYE